MEFNKNSRVKLAGRRYDGKIIFEISTVENPERILSTLEIPYFGVLMPGRIYYERDMLFFWSDMENNVYGDKMFDLSSSGLRSLSRVFVSTKTTENVFTHVVRSIVLANKF